MTDERFRELAREIANTFCEMDRAKFAEWFRWRAKKARAFDSLVRKQLEKDRKEKAQNA